MREFHRPSKAAMLLVALVAMSVSAVAQPAMQPAIQTFTQEATLPWANVGVSTTPNIPANVLQAVTSGALEIRQAVDYLPNSSRLRIRHFLVAPGSPNPTPVTANATPVEDYFVSIDQILRQEDSIVFIGRVDQRNVDSPFGNFQNRTVIYTVGYQTGTPTRFSSSTLVIPGRMATYVVASTGTLAFVTTPGGGNGGDTLVADAGPDITTVSSEIMLDATRSKDPDGGALTYSWRVVSGSAGLTGANTATPRVQLANNFGEYIFELTVTNAKGQTATDRVRVLYSGRF